VKPEEMLEAIQQTKGFWGGNRIRVNKNTFEGGFHKEKGPSGTFARKDDLQAKWESMYYKRGICR
jgi:hypothetical protein